MRISQVTSALNQVDQVRFKLPNGTYVPEHFHVTEIGHIQKAFIDCGGTVRTDQVINFQLWTATDYDHRLAPAKLQNIIDLSYRILNLRDAEIEVEYQGETIEKYGLEFDGVDFVLTPQFTDCLAKDNCGIPQTKQKVSLASLGSSDASCCSPGSGCC